MTPTIVESPYAGDVARNRVYLERCLFDCIRLGESPYASHKMLTDCLDDAKPEERAKGIEAGLAWRRLAGKRVFFVDYGLSPGMTKAMALYEREHLSYVCRKIGVNP